MNFLYAQVKHLSWTSFTHRSNIYHELSLHTGQTYIMNFLYAQVKHLSWTFFTHRPNIFHVPFRGLCAHFLYKFVMLSVALQVTIFSPFSKTTNFSIYLICAFSKIMNINICFKQIFLRWIDCYIHLFSFFSTDMV